MAFQASNMKWIFSYLAVKRQQNKSMLSQETLGKEQNTS